MPLVAAVALPRSSRPRRRSSASGSRRAPMTCRRAAPRLAPSASTPARGPSSGSRPPSRRRTESSPTRSRASRRPPPGARRPRRRARGCRRASWRSRRCGTPRRGCGRRLPAGRSASGRPRRARSRGRRAGSARPAHATSWASFRESGAKGRLKPIASRSFSAPASQTSSICSRVSPSGFSTKTALPARSAAAEISAWVSCRVPTTTRSTSGASTASRQSVPGRAPSSDRASVAAVDPPAADDGRHAHAVLALEIRDVRRRGRSCRRRRGRRAPRRSRGFGRAAELRATSCRVAVAHVVGQHRRRAAASRPPAPRRPRLRGRPGARARRAGRA